jgi:hypothetical protein
MADSPLVDLLADEANAIRWLDNVALAEFLTDVEQIGFEEARHRLKRFRQKQQTLGEDWKCLTATTSR